MTVRLGPFAPLALYARLRVILAPLGNILLTPRHSAQQPALLGITVHQVPLRNAALENMPPRVLWAAHLAPQIHILLRWAPHLLAPVSNVPQDRPLQRVPYHALLARMEHILVEVVHASVAPQGNILLAQERHLLPVSHAPRVVIVLLKDP